MKEKKYLISVLALVALLALAGGMSLAQGPGPQGEVDTQSSVSVAANVSSKISYQGVLKENGQPVTGSRDMTFRLYSDDTCSTQVGSDIVKSGVQVTDGLFSVDLDVTHSYFDGQGLWLEVEVGGTKIGCQELLPVPYALSLRPGAKIQGSSSATLYAYNTSTTGTAYGLDARSASSDGKAIYAWASANNGTTYGVYAWSSSPDGYGGYFGATGGVALKAAGSGVIQSTAVSRIFVPGTEAVPHATSRTDLTLEYYGRGTVVVKSSSTGTEQLVIPITIPAILYGQPVRIADMRVHYQTSNSASYINATYLYRQDSAGGYYTLIGDPTDRTSTSFTYYYLACSANECQLGNDASILSAVLNLYFADTADQFTIGGIRLTLEHD